MKRISYFFMMMWVGFVVACSVPDPEKFTEPQLLGGEWIQPDVLNAGYTAYTHYCFACHGELGDGKGPASYSYYPPPRDFRKALFKFAGVASGSLPSDEELERLVRVGLDGTAMLPWDISEEELWLTIQYMKTFSSEKRGYRKCRKPGEPQTCKKLKKVTYKDNPYEVIPFDARWNDHVFDQWAMQQSKNIKSDMMDRWKKNKRLEAQQKYDEAVQEGAKNYHKLGCHLCHASYGSAKQIKQWGGNPRDQYPFDSTPKYSREYKTVLMPPDFLRHRVRSPQHYQDDKGALRYDPKDFYRVIASGIPGTAMPAWGETLTAKELWSISYFVMDVSEMMPNKQGKIARQSLMNGSIDSIYDLDKK